MVLLPLEGELNGRLADALSSRNWQATAHHDPYLALADLSLRDRAQASRAAWGLQPSENAVLLLGHREVLARGNMDCEALIAAARRFLPRIEIYEFTAGRLAPVAGGDPSRHESPRRDPASAPLSPRPPEQRPDSVDSIPPPGMLRLTRPPEDPPAAAPTPITNGTTLIEDDDNAATTTAVSREEIDMLLELDNGEPSP